MPLKVAGIEVATAPLGAVGRQGDDYSGFHPGTTVLPAGHRRHIKTRALDVDTVWDRDIAIPMRDGITLRADVFRPTGSEKVPALLCWSPYGKTGAGMQSLGMVPNRAGIPESALSGYEKFEAPDPAEWVPRAYAIVNIDARGVYDSEGDARFNGVAEGEDGYDTIEYLATLDWCNGNVALVGNSWLAMVQYHIAARQPPHLKCIAPLEGQSDMYRETLCRGGIPATAFLSAVFHTLSGRGEMEDPAQMLQRYPDWNDYWEDKRADFSKINVPAYILASYSTGIHTEGSLRCFEELKTPKWLTIHDTQEWHDLYQPNRTNELNTFFDRYLKGIENGWENHPLVRVSLMGYNRPNITDLVQADWPPPKTTHKRLYLTSSNSLVEQPPQTAGTSSYQSDINPRQDDADPEELHFSYTFHERTHVLGYADAKLYVSCADADDFDVYVQLRKADSKGNMLRAPTVPLETLGMKAEDVPPINVLQYLGPDGMLRASRRELSEKLSQPHRPVSGFQSTLKVKPGDIVPLSLGIRPGGMIFEPGEKLVLKVSGHPMILAEFAMLYGSHRTANTGKHVVHHGGEYGSFIDVPLVEL